MRLKSGQEKARSAVLVAGGQVALIWLADVLLCAVAAVVSFRIRVRGQE